MSPWKVFVRSSLICGLLGVVIFGLGLHRIEPLGLTADPLQFDFREAYDYMARLSKGFPYRVTWGESRKKAALWLKDEFRKMGYEPRGLLFSEVIAGKQYNDLEDIYVEKPGTEKPDEILVVMAHYDIVDTTVEGAMDDGSGVGVVLELAKVFSRLKTRRTIVFLITDSEEYGAFWGARAFTRGYAKADRIVAAASFDYLTPEHQSRIAVLCDGLKTGYTPLWLREIALNSIRSVGGVKAVDLDNVVEFIERAMQIPASDHGPFLQAGIPAFNWAGQTDKFPYEMAYYHHTPRDTVEAMLPETFDPYGKAAERALRSLDALAAIPANFRDSSYWKVTDSAYIDGVSVTLLHILAFIPFLVYSLAKFGVVLRNRPRARVIGVILNEAKAMGILLGSLLLGYTIMLALPLLKIITRYEVFPATQKSLLLYSPDFLAMLLVILAVVAVFRIFSGTFKEPEDSVGYFEIRHAVHAAFLAIIIFLAFLKNSYLATLMLLPPAYFWTALRNRKRTEDRILNMLLLVGGSITFVATALLLTSIFHVGVIYWYLFLSAAYGLISAYSVVLFFMALTVMIRLFRAFVL